MEGVFGAGYDRPAKQPEYKKSRTRELSDEKSFCLLWRKHRLEENSLEEKRQGNFIIKTRISIIAMK